MRTYIGTKIVCAVPLGQVEFLEKKWDKTKGPFRTDIPENLPGYLVVYPDGYESWSPKKVFETAYREVTPEEAELMQPTAMGAADPAGE